MKFYIYEIPDDISFNPENEWNRYTMCLPMFQQNIILIP